MVEFLGWPLHCNVLGVKSYQVIDLELWRWLATPITGDLILTLSDSDLLLAVIVEEREHLGKVMGAGVRTGDIESDGGLGVIAIVHKER